MATLVDSVITDAKSLLGDPAARRVSFTDWVSFYNRACRKAATKFNALSTEAFFDILADVPKFAYPEDMHQMRKIEYNSSGLAVDPNSWRTLSEIFSDEFISATSSTLPSGEPTRYYASQAYFQLVPTPSTPVALGGRITYWRIPADVVPVSASAVPVGTLMEFPDFMRTYVTDNMVMNAKQKLYMYEEAGEDLRMIQIQENELRDRIEDRSADRRSSLRAVGAENPYGGMV